MKHILKLISLNILLLASLYLCSIGVLKILLLIGATYSNTHSVAFAASLFAMVVLHVISYHKKRERKIKKVTNYSLT